MEELTPDAASIAQPDIARSFNAFHSHCPASQARPSQGGVNEKSRRQADCQTIENNATTLVLIHPYAQQLDTGHLKRGRCSVAS